FALKHPAAWNHRRPWRLPEECPQKTPALAVRLSLLRRRR
ncbi:hypothetical protein HMPREF9554_02754, partial [Treponema phagedenis F0421]